MEQYTDVYPGLDGHDRGELVTENPQAPVGATETLARFASQLTFEAIPADVTAHARLCVLDALGCGLFASATTWCRIVNELAVERSGAGACTIWGTPHKVTADFAALANGTSGHGFELDDIHPGGVHPGPVAVSVALALAQELDRSGRDLLTAVVAGYEVGSRVAMAMLSGHAKAGFHAQGTVGCFVAVSTAGNMLGLDPLQLRDAFAHVGSMAGGLIAAQQGGMTKRLHSGRAAQSGVYAALLAGKGLTGIPDVLENSFGGFCKAMGGDVALLDELLPTLGTEWETKRVGFKIYPSCGSSHSALHALRQLRREHGISAEEVASVTVHGSSHAVMKVGTPYQPNSVASAQMSLGFTGALMLRFGEIPVGQLNDEGIRDPATIELASRITMHADPDIDARGPGARHATRIRIDLRDGRVLEANVEDRPGSTAMPITEDDLREKFRSLAGERLSQERVATLEKVLSELTEIDDVATVTSLLDPVES